MTIIKEIENKKRIMFRSIDSVSAEIRKAEELLKGIPVRCSISIPGGHMLHWGPMADRKGQQRLYVVGIDDAKPLMECATMLRLEIAPHLPQLLKEVSKDMDIYLLGIGANATTQHEQTDKERMEEEFFLANGYFDRE